MKQIGLDHIGKCNLFKIFTYREDYVCKTDTVKSISLIVLACTTPILS